MTLRATTREQFRIVLTWVKEHPVLARGDNEVEKGGRELKNKLWKKLAIELNELGPPIRTWMAWKRVLTDYKYSLKKKIQRRIANTSQGGSEILASLSDLETEALHASLLDWDFTDSEKMPLSETPPIDDAQMQQKSPENILTLPQGPPIPNSSLPNVLTSVNGNGNVGSMELVNPQMYNGNAAGVTLQANCDIPDVVKVEANDMNMENSIPNGGTHMYTPLHHVENISAIQEDAVEPPPSFVENVPMTNELSNFRVGMNETAATHEIQNAITQQQEIVPPPESLWQTPCIITSAPEIMTTTVQNTIVANPLHAEEYADASSAGPAMQLPVIKSEPTQPPLSAEKMNLLIAREFDRMASAHKVRKVNQRKRETRDKPKPPALQGNATQEQKRQKEKSKNQSEQSDRAKRVAPKRPRPKIQKDGKDTKKFMSGREFRHCLLALLTEANEMEKRRIAITETKVRNQTEIQNLEITRMNLEIMKLQKEITLLDHGAKILP